MGIRLNMNGVEPQTGGSGPLPEGEYIVKIIEATEKTASTGTPGIECTMEVLVGEHEGGRVWDNIWLSEKALGVARHKLECAGVPIPEDEFVLEAQHLVGRRVQVVVRHEAYTDRESNQRTAARVKAWSAPPGAGAASDDPFSGGGAGTGIPNPAPAGPADDDDIPF